MRIKITLLAIFVLAINILSSDLPKGIQLIKTENGYTINFKLSEYTFSDVKVNGETYTKINVEEYGTTNEAGLPSLPAISFNVMIQLEESSPVADIINVNSREVKIDNRIFPMQEPWEKVYSLSDRPFKINSQYYNSKGTELPLVKVSEPFYIGGVKGVRVTIQPFTYNPLENKLTVIENGTVSLNQNSAFSYSAKAEGMNDFLKSVYVNYNNTNTKSVGNYLIITAPEFEAGLAPFVTHKSSKGYNVTLFTTAVTGISTTAIKAFIQAKYDNLATRPEYILLVGDVNKIPIWTGSGA